ncbi:diacylglycerol/lipid kinase family protein [Spirochaeta lutea]|uniref:DAGKc domain-containing protein n=1 Tax=Spirochaeta lutea TaxID=1480694 RepID=A0A098R149_9SPIO|nr:diacylglycerol kinase family protein [Spirochaeta lutea]KGE73825.1 hypothetical protein DC28_01005 [Spirochaeta lutea]
MTVEQISRHLTELCAHIISRSPYWSESRGCRPMLHVILNPAAGGFMREAVRNQFFDDLESRIQAFLPMEMVMSHSEARARISIYPTQAPGSGSIIARDILDRFQLAGVQEDDQYPPASSRENRSQGESGRDWPYSPETEGARGWIPSRETDRPEHLIMSIGGDGTHLEVLNGLIESLGSGAGNGPSLGSARTSGSSPGADDAVVGLCRVPMGTGNDGVDLLSSGDIAGVLYARAGLAAPEARAVRVTTARGEVAVAGNIAGLGLDAYVVFLSERYKRILPGNIYKFAADLGVLSYKSRYNLGEARIRLQTYPGSTEQPAGQGRGMNPRESHASETVQNFQVPALIPGIICMGASGFRTYGNGLPVLPGEENVCIIPLGTVAQNIALKSQLYRGSHGKDPRVGLHRAAKMVVDYHGRLPMQLDGEVRWIEPQDFPLEFEVIQVPGVRLLGNRSNDADVQSQRSRYQVPAVLFPERYRDNA